MTRSESFFALKLTLSVTGYNTLLICK